MAIGRPIGWAPSIGLGLGILLVLACCGPVAYARSSAAPPAFLLPPARQHQRRAPPLAGISSSSGGSASSTGTETEASQQTQVRLPPSISHAPAKASSSTTTEALAAAAAAARASTSGEEAVLLERVGSKDVEIRLPASFTPLERIAVSAEGDLQRIVASYYNAAVTVAIKRCQEVEPGLFDREVDLAVLGQVFCTATSSLVPRTAECARLLREQGLGLGQLFRHLKVHPDFKLLEVGKTPAKGFWRLYELDCPGMLNCRILECFRPDIFHLTKQV